MDAMEDPQRTPTTTAKKGRKTSKLRAAPVSSADIPKVMEALRSVHVSCMPGQVTDEGSGDEWVGVCV